MRAAALFGVLLLFSCSSCGDRSQRELIIYTSQDQQFAEPVLNEFTKQTGIRVRAVYDSEAVKTVGLAQRLIAEAGGSAAPHESGLWDGLAEA